MNFYVNEIIQDNSSEKQYRIVWVDSGNLILYLIELNNKNAFPEKKPISKLEELIVLDQWRKIKEDKYIKNYSSEYEIKHYSVRDSICLK
ncbi:hypothetical protein SAMN05216243_2519 [Sediminibacillus albus]|uniref:Uncharacterized protein n=1 Tax=Sediminibacillus albus TaxID=407036 RepID=A0A1G9AJP4_9BACI|nr:hypothetical protein SAMN05216243_2519 [Sediminibacillus albus]